MNLSILTPDGTTNYVTNPALRYDTTDWNAQGATIARVLTHARFGIASLQVVSSGVALNEGAYLRVSSLSGTSEPITVSAYVQGTGKVRIRLDNNVVGGTEFASQPTELSETRWQRIWVTGFSTGGNDLRVYIETAEGIAKARTFYVDGVQLERHGYLTAYCDGDQEGCRWNGIFHASASTRPASTRAGGRYVQIAGEGREEPDLYVTEVSGLGMATVKNNFQSFALAPGGFFGGSKIAERVFTLTFHAKHNVDGTDNPVSLAALHHLRQFLIDLLKPDKTGGDEDIWFQYQDGDVPLYFRARYDGGLEGGWDIRNQFVNSFPVRFLAVDPTVQEDNQGAQALDFQDVTLTNNTAARIDGRWGNLNYGVGPSPDGIYALARGPRGEIYGAGNFVNANADAAAVDPNIFANGVARWDGTKWNRLGSGMNAFAIPGLAVAPNGYVYVTGNFTTIGGVAANRIAYWDGVAWNAMGTGLDAAGNALAIAPNGDVYAGGIFTTAGGVVSARIARWDGTKWNRVGQFGGLNGQVRSIVIKADGSKVYVGGDFTDQSGLAANALLRVTIYDTATGLFAALGGGFNNPCYALELGLDGSLFAGGNFTASGTTTINHLGHWNGAAWTQLGEGVNDNVWCLDLFDDGRLLAVGEFYQTGTRALYHLTVWNGSVLLPLDAHVYAPGTVSNIAINANLYACLVTPVTQDIFIGGDTFYDQGSGGKIQAAGRTTVTNLGSAECAPVIYARGPGILRWIENQTLKLRVYLDLTLLSGEEVFFDFGRASLQSTVRGNLAYAILPGSDFHAFRLAPGENVIAAFMESDVNALMTITHTPLHWSADATQREIAA